jgi:hypothetical protein
MILFPHKEMFLVFYFTLVNKFTLLSVLVVHFNLCVIHQFILFKQVLVCHFVLLVLLLVINVCVLILRNVK